MGQSEEYIKKSEEIRTKYKDVIDALARKYDKDVGVGYDMLLAIGRAILHDEEPLYSQEEVELDTGELFDDYCELIKYFN